MSAGSVHSLLLIQTAAVLRASHALQVVDATLPCLHPCSCSCLALTLNLRSTAAPATAGMDRKDWLALCAVHSDAWLYSLAFFYAARFDADGRAELFSLLNQHPTVYEVRWSGWGASEDWSMLSSGALGVIRL